MARVKAVRTMNMNKCSFNSRGREREREREREKKGCSRELSSGALFRRVPEEPAKKKKKKKNYPRRHRKESGARGWRGGGRVEDKERRAARGSWENERRRCRSRNPSPATIIRTTCFNIIHISTIVVYY
ncbi:hypothetical protein PUN28_010692 [Cardiocondyla obscurior]|uniref:Uncharacterized protein n=1 Tax=Cardiocondyla obscurior TaxID=286306 RepID=A0AAW2FN58_9HYME